MLKTTEIIYLKIGDIFSATAVAFYDNLLLSVATTVATPAGESSVRKRQKLLQKHH